MDYLDWLLLGSQIYFGTAVSVIVFVVVGGIMNWVKSKTPATNGQPPLDEQLSNLGHLYLNAANAAKKNPNAQRGEEKRLRDASNALFNAAAASREPLDVKELMFL